MIDKKKLMQINPKGNIPKKVNVQNKALEINNDEIEGLIQVYAADSTGENLSKLLDKIHVGRVLVPANAGPKGPSPIVIKHQSGDVFMPVFTSKKHLGNAPQSQLVVNMPFIDVCATATSKDVNANVEVVGVVINPFSNNLVFKRELLDRMLSVESARKNGVAPAPATPKAPQLKQVEMTAQEYVIFERRNFELAFLPQRFLKNKGAFIDELLEKKEELIDAMYEEMYQQKRMYPYLPDDFSIMPLSISDSLTVVRIDLQQSDMAVGCSSRVYLTWDSEKDSARYFTIENGEGKTKNLGEVTALPKHFIHGEAPVEGAELSTILDMLD